MTNNFTVPAPPGEATPTLQRKELITTILIGAYLAAARQFAELGQPLLAKYAFQMGAVHAEHRAMARAMQALEGVSTAIPPRTRRSRPISSSTYATPTQSLPVWAFLGPHR